MGGTFRDLSDIDSTPVPAPAVPPFVQGEHPARGSVLLSVGLAAALPQLPAARRRPAACLSSAFSMLRVSRGGSWMVSSAGMPACSSRPRSSSASSSAPNSSARLVIHSQSRNTMTPASEP